MSDVPPVSLMPFVEAPLPTFVSLDDKYLCVVCHLPLQAPVQTECGHRLCRQCLDSLFEGPNDTKAIPCPGKEDTCGMITKAKVYPDFCALRELKSHRVYCPNRDMGCMDIVTWVKLSEHASACPFKGRLCPYREFGCNERIPEKEYDNHIYHTCACIPIPCDFCKVNYPKNLMEGHLLNDCQEVMVPCPFKCGMKNILKKELEEHKKVCTEKPEECQFRQQGCAYRGSKRAVQRHVAEEASSHVELLSGCLANTERTVTKLQEQCQNSAGEAEKFKNAAHALRNQITSLKSKVESQENKIRDLQRVAADQLGKIARLEEGCQSYATNGAVAQQQAHIDRMKTTQTSLEQRIATLPQTGPIPGLSSEKMKVYDRQIGIQDVRLAEMDLRFQCLETSSFDGVLIWKITEYSRRKQEACSGRTLSLYSQPFFTNRYGYKMCARAYLNGDGTGRGTHLSLFFTLMRGEYDSILPWPFKQKVTLSLVDQQGGRRNINDTFRPDPASNSFRKPISDMNIASGCPCFITQARAEKPPYLIDDSMFIKVIVDVTDLPAV